MSTAEKNAAVDTMISKLTTQVKAKKAAFAAAKTGKKQPAKKPATSKGKTDAALKDNFEMIQRVYDARLAGASFNELEQTFGLKPANGMTAYRMIQRAEKLKKAK